MLISSSTCPKCQFRNSPLSASCQTSSTSSAPPSSQPSRYSAASARAQAVSALPCCTSSRSRAAPEWCPTLLRSRLTLRYAARRPSRRRPTSLTFHTRSLPTPTLPAARLRLSSSCVSHRLGWSRLSSPRATVLRGCASRRATRSTGTSARPLRASRTTRLSRRCWLRPRTTGPPSSPAWRCFATRCFRRTASSSILPPTKPPSTLSVLSSTSLSVGCPPHPRSSQAHPRGLTPSAYPSAKTRVTPSPRRSIMLPRAHSYLRPARRRMALTMPSPASSLAATSGTTSVSWEVPTVAAAPSTRQLAASPSPRTAIPTCWAPSTFTPAPLACSRTWR
mmetsp:Transcript_59008/g.97554  ORF Transcript_59008/g.97554 Transcript_59008/m.97554 type:complete len:335 (+) Transcript_59008:124-1128(+)